MSNLSLISGSANAEASQIIPVVNTLINNINSGVAGMLFANLSTGATGANTTATDLQSYTLPAGFLTATRPGLRIRAWGITGATAANNKTITLNFGATAYTILSAAAANAVVWSATLEVWRTGAATQRIFGMGIQGTTNVVGAYTAGTDDLSTALTIRVIGTNGTAAANDILCYAMTGEVIQ